MSGLVNPFLYLKKNLFLRICDISGSFVPVAVNVIGTICFYVRNERTKRFDILVFRE